MENIKEQISRNISLIRKNRKLTQIELAEKLNYSDKAISRWENGESLPDVETLYKLANILQVPVSTFFEENLVLEDVQNKKNNHTSDKIMVTFLSCAVVWLVALICYVYLKSYTQTIFWQAFIWAIPVTCLVLGYFNRVWGNKRYQIYIKSALIWGFITAIYCHFIHYNIWIIFLIAPLIQTIIIINYYIKPMKNETKEKRN